MYLRQSLCFWLGIVVNGLLLGTTLPVPVEAQTLSWIRQLETPSNDFSTGVATDSNGNVYISSGTEGPLAGASQGESNASWVAKYDSAGTLVWQRQLGTSDSDFSTGVATDSNGNVYISGNTTLFDAWVAKYDSAGTLVWKRQLGTSGSDISTGVATDSNGNVYISGNTSGSLTGANQGGSIDAWVAKYDSVGTLVWQQQLGTSTSNDESNGVATDSNGNVYISGSTSGSLAGASQGGSIDAWVAKYDSAGTLVWQRQLGTSDEDSSFDVATDSNGNVYISGGTSGSLAGASQGEFDAWVAKYNSAGTLVWQRQLGTSDYDTFTGATTDSNGNVYISGGTARSLTRDDQAEFDAWVVKYDSSGTLVWKQQLEISSCDISSGVAIDSNGNVYISGSTGDLSKNFDAWVAKYTQ